MSTPQKLALFNGVDTLAMETGAGLANIVYCPPNIMILLIVHPSLGSYLHRWGYPFEKMLKAYIKHWLPMSEVHKYPHNLVRRKNKQCPMDSCPFRFKNMSHAIEFVRNHVRSREKRV